MSSKHTQRGAGRALRARWVLLILILLSVVGALLFDSWAGHDVSSAPKRRACTHRVPGAVHNGEPVLRMNSGKVETAAMSARTVALTFDGGPDPARTPRLLDMLRWYRAHATFFVSGSQAARHPDLMQRIVAEGHEVGSYTYTGADLGSVSPTRARTELSLTQMALAGSAGVNTRLLRLPHTTTTWTLCDGNWTAARRAAADGYLLVAADRARKPMDGVIRQYRHTPAAYKDVARLLRTRNVNFTTVTDGLGLSSPHTRVSSVAHWQGLGLVWVQAGAHALVKGLTWCVAGMVWLFAIAGGLAVLRLVLLIFFAHIHVRRVRRSRGSRSSRSSGSFRGGGPTVPRQQEVNEPVTVLVPAHNEEAGIEATIRSLLASTHPELRIIVIDDGSTDRTAEIATQITDPRLTLIRKANAGKASALNTGLAHTTSDIVVMVDADTVFEPDALHRLVQPLAHPMVGAVSGNTKVGNRGCLLGKWQHLEYVLGFNLDRRMFELLECMPTVPGAIGAYRREAVLGVGGVSEDTLAEDTDLTMALCRAGWRVVYEESAIAWTEVPSKLNQLWRQRYRWCYGTLQSMWKHRHALVEFGPAGRFGRRGLTYLAFFQIGMPLFAPMMDLFALYGMLYLDPVQSGLLWLGFLALQMVGAGYALRLDGERLKTLWVLPLQLLVYRQLMYVVIIRSVGAALLGTRLKWHRVQRTGSAAEQVLSGEQVGRPGAGGRPAPGSASVG